MILTWPTIMNILGLAESSTSGNAVVLAGTQSRKQACLTLYLGFKRSLQQALLHLYDIYFTCTTFLETPMSCSTQASEVALFKWAALLALFCDA